MNLEEYKEIIKNGEREEWYGDLVPSVLLTKKVRVIADMIMENVLKLEGTVTDFRKGTKERTRSENYLDGLKKNVANLPYTSNGLITDTLMAKYKRIMVEIEKEKESKTKPKTRKTRKPKTDTTTKPKKDTSKGEVKNEETTPVVKVRRGKNNNLIFGKK